MVISNQYLLNSNNCGLLPERCKGLVSVSGFLISTPLGNQKPLPPKASFVWWYQFYFATEIGRAGYDLRLRKLNVGAEHVDDRFGVSGFDCDLALVSPVART